MLLGTAVVCFCDVGLGHPCVKRARRMNSNFFAVVVYGVVVVVVDSD